MDASAGDAQAAQFVLWHLGDSIVAFPASVRDALVAKFVGDYQDPSTAQLERVLRKRLTDDEARHLLFAPTEQQYKYYADLLSLQAPSSRDTAEDATTWQFLLRKRFLTLFYLKHARNWPLVAEFVLHDGLQILADLFMHPDLQMRGQVIDSFVQITSHGAFEWFDDPVGYEARVLHAKMVSLAAPRSGFLKSIVENVRLYEQREEESATSDLSQRLPGGTFVLLQVLAFFLSWVRKFYTRNELRLSRELLDLLKEWKTRTRSENPDEVELARQVYDDFSRWPPIDDGNDGGARAAQHVELANDTEIKSKTLFSPRKIEELLSTDDAREDALDEAISLCSDAIDANVNRLEALLFRAKARARRIESVALLSTKEEGQLCLQDCKAVLDRDPFNIDAWKCQLRIFESLQLWVDGRDALDAWHASSLGDQADTPPCAGFLPEDLAFLQARRAFFDEKAHEFLQQQALERRQHATRTAKEREVMRLLLGRTPTTSSTACSNPDAIPAAVQKRPPEDTALSTRPGSHDVLARFRSASSKKQPATSPQSVADAPLEGVVKARSFVRKFAQCKRDPLAIRSLLEATPTHLAISAIDNALPETSLALVLDALVGGDVTDDLARVLRQVLQLPRLALVREMATPHQQQTLERLVAQAHAKLATALTA